MAGVERAVPVQRSRSCYLCGGVLMVAWHDPHVYLGLVDTVAWPRMLCLARRDHAANSFGWRRAIRRRDGCHPLRHTHGAFFSLLLARFFLWPVQTGKGRTGHGTTGKFLPAATQGQWQHSRVKEAVTVTTSQSDPRRRRTSL